MPSTPAWESRLRQQRLARGWSQEQLAQLTGVSRTGIGAIESCRLVPSTATALALAGAFGCRVEDLFSLGHSVQPAIRWAVPPRSERPRYWLAEVGGGLWAYPAEAVDTHHEWHDGVADGDRIPSVAGDTARQTLVMAGCDPAAGLLVASLARAAGVRLLVLPRSSRAALELLRNGMVHLAGLHLGAAASGGNPQVVAERLGAGYALVRVAQWQEGLALGRDVSTRSVRSLLGRRLRWVGREIGSGARLCQDELLGERPAPRRVAADHRGIVESIKNGWADVGVCVRLLGEEAGLDFVSVREEDYDLCFRQDLTGDPCLAALLGVLRSSGFRGQLGQLPGYNARQTGELVSVN